MAKTPEEMVEDINKGIETIKGDLSKALKQEDLDNVSKEIETLKDSVKDFDAEKFNAQNKEIERLEGVLKSQGTEISKMKEGNGTKEVLSFEDSISKAIKDKSEALKTWVENKSIGGQFTLYDTTKAVGSTTSANVTTDTTPANYAASNADGFSEFIRTEVFIEDFFDKGNTDKPSLPYVNETAGEGDAAAVTEGSLKPLIDADYVTKFSEAKKVAGRMKVSEEALSDFPWLQSAMTTTLKRKHDIARQSDLITRVIANSTPYAAGMLTGIAASVDNANKYDVLAAMQTAIAVQSEGTFMANVAFVNNIDALQMKLTKNVDGDYLLPPFITKDGRTIDGMVVVAKPSIPVGDFIIGDFKNFVIRDVWGYKVEIGRSGDDFAENMYTMIGESRYHFYITDNDKRAIINGTFATVAAALETV